MVYKADFPGSPLLQHFPVGGLAHLFHVQHRETPVCTLFR